MFTCIQNEQDKYNHDLSKKHQLNFNNRVDILVG